MVKDIFEALQNTPIPTILVVAGIAFLLLSVAGQLAGRIAVPPERQRHATIIGGLLLVVGVALNIGPQLWTSPKPPPPDTKPLPPRPEIKPSPPDTKPLPPEPEIKPEPPPDPSRGTKPSSPGPEIPTKYAGVMARITRFGTSGAFIILEITVRNMTEKTTDPVCNVQFLAELYDQNTGDSWKAVDAGGDVTLCHRLPPSGKSETWMRFKVSSPDERVFSLKSQLFNTPVENLVLGKPS